MYTYIQRPGCKKENTATYVYVRPGLVYMTGSERRNNVVVVFIGRQRNAWEPTGWVGTECVVVFIGRAWTEQAMETRTGIPQNRGNGLVFDQPRSKRILFIGRGLAYCKTKETD